MTGPVLHVNGRFLSQPISGVQRYARELLSALDRRLANDPSLAAKVGQVPVWYPSGAQLLDPPEWKVLEIKPLEGRAGHAWEQITLGRKVGSAPLISLCGSGPLLCQNQLLVIHDANIWAFPEAFSKSYRVFHKIMRPLLARRVKHLGTVSHFSAGELSRCLGVNVNRFDVIYNSAEHMQTATGDAETLTRYGLSPNGYVFAAGNQSPNKNMARLVEALTKLEDSQLVLAIAGGYAPGVSQVEVVGSDRIKLLGRVTDAELQSLYENASAFVWPSLYEGFGIPPLEAMTRGTPVLSSNTTAMPEVLENAALYFDPENVDDIATCLKRFCAMSQEDKQALGAAGQDRARSFSWDVSASKLLDVMFDGAV